MLPASTEAALETLYKTCPTCAAREPIGRLKAALDSIGNRSEPSNLAVRLAPPTRVASVAELCERYGKTADEMHEGLDDELARLNAEDPDAEHYVEGGFLMVRGRNNYRTVGEGLA
jgi:hypothetical protein